jgi:hypothetical protein
VNQRKFEDPNHRFESSQHHLAIRDGHMHLEDIECFRTMRALSNIGLPLNLAFLKQNVHDLPVEQ